MPLQVFVSRAELSVPFMICDPHCYGPVSGLAEKRDVRSAEIFDRQKYYFPLAHVGLHVKSRRLLTFDF